MQFESSEAMVIIQTILSTVETKILPSVEAKEFFQRNPFSTSLREAGRHPTYNSSFANSLLHGVILPSLTRESATAPCAGFIIGMSFGQQRTLWEHHGLGIMVHKAHCVWREHYVSRIQQAVDNFLTSGKASTSKKNIKAARELFSASEQESPSRPLFYEGVQDVLKTLYTCPERASGTALRAGDSDDKKLWGHQLHARSIRDVFSLQEEAFVLLTIRKHLLITFGRRMYAVVAPRSQPFMPQPIAVTDHGSLAVLPDFLAPAPALPAMIDDDDEVAASTQVVAQDVKYYRGLLKALELQESLKEVSVLFNLYDVFSALPASSSSSSSSSEDEGSMSSSSGSDESCSSSKGTTQRRLKKVSKVSKDGPKKACARRKLRLRPRPAGFIYSKKKDPEGGVDVCGYVIMVQGFRRFRRQDVEAKLLEGLFVCGNDDGKG
ncbi:expressed unknown protein [Seminavis robusta]|uniref:Uncharacterized protein n=1 Tax=Seminavis robusta TaxID=568900 RepID=A0A9N8EAS6_9STRA|nr:expressed unknown protein [Seminavis robusta]|eukprot:Sro873_g214050.1 n/a (436) ;mRNA; r:23998-25760